MLATLASAPTSALAQPQSPQLAGDRAVEFANRGLEHYDAGRWDEAFEAFQMADGIVPSTPFKLYMARTRQKQGRLLEARELYRRVASVAVGDADAVGKKAQEDAAGELAAVDASLPSLLVSVEGVTDEAIVTIDGKVVDIKAPVEVDPGMHTLVAKSAGKQATLEQAVEAGQKKLAVTLRVAASVEPAVPPSDGGAALWPWGVTLGAVGVASLVTGGVFGGLALSQDASIGERCAPTCSSGERATLEDDRDTMLLFADVSTATLVIGGVLAATGVTLLVVDVTSSSEAPIKAAFGPGSARVWLEL